MVVRVGAASVNGNVRDHNEDVVVLGPGLFGVADGMGGHAAGDVAAATAAREVVSSIEAGRDGLAAAGAAHRAVLDLASSSPSYEGMGTTLCFGVSGWWDGEPAIEIVNVGDSRAYALDVDRRFAQLTKDQSWVQELVDNGMLSEEDARIHPRRNVVTSSVGTPGACEPVGTIVAAEPGMRLLFCSDGISDELEVMTIATVLGGRSHPQEIADTLVATVLDGDGYDNITAVVVDVLAVRRLDG